MLESYKTDKIMKDLKETLDNWVLDENNISGVKLEICKLYEDAIIPTFAHPTDTGADIYSYETHLLMDGEYHMFSTGISIALPPNTEGQVRARSGLAAKHGIGLVNGVGSIDNAYRGPLGVILVNHGSKPFLVEKGMRIAQLVVKPILKVNIIEVTSLDATDRGVGGFGSTGE